MKIRKTFSGNLPDNKIVNSNSTSETDTYSCKYLNERNVIVSSEEPTTGEEVWIQRSGNIFDKNNYGLFKGYMSSANINFVANNSGYLVYIPCMPNTDYIVTREVLENNFQVGSGNIVPVNNGQVTQVILAETSSRVTIKTGANDTYLYIYVKYDGNSSYTLEQILDSLRVETPKKIHTKNDNGYEEFYNEANREVYSTSEQRIGTWIDGKPLYRKTIFREVAIEKDVPLVINSETNDIHRIVDIRGSISSSNKNAYRSINTYNLQDNKVSISMLIEQNGYIRIYSTDDWGSPDIVITFEYTKTID